MKTLLLAGIIGLTFGCSNAQKSNDTNVPEAVKTAFGKKYPDVKKVSWEAEGKTYEAEFTMYKVEYSAVFDGSGVFQEEETEIKVSELPTSVVDFCSKTYADHKISEAAKITNANGTISYEAEMSKGKIHFDVIFDANGNFVSKGEPASEDDEDED